MAKTARNLISGSGTISTTLDSPNLSFSQSQNFKYGAAVVVSDGQQFTISGGAGTLWTAFQHARATASGATFQTSDPSTSRARGSGPIIVQGRHYQYVAPVDDTGAADIWMYYDTLVPNENGVHPYTGDTYTGRTFDQDEPPGDYMVPPRFRWWDDYAARASLLSYAYDGTIGVYSWGDVQMASNRGGVVPFVATTAGNRSWSPFGGAVYNISNPAEQFYQSFRLAKRPILHARWASRTGGSVYEPPTRRIGFMVTPTAGTADAEPSDGAFFRHTTTGSIKAVARKANTETVLDTGVNVSDGVFHHGMLISRLGGTVVEVWVDAAMKGLLTTNLPLPTTDMGCLFNLGLGNFNTEGFDLDYYYVEADRPS